MCNVRRRFFKEFAKRAKPLNAMTRAEVPPDLPKPSDVALAAFDDLRQALLAPPILALPNAKGQIIADIDVCADQLGCTLLQEQPDGTRLPVGYWSRGLSPAEKKTIKQRNANALALCGACLSSDISSTAIDS